MEDLLMKKNTKPYILGIKWVIMIINARLHRIEILALP
jgi:hypothetical protein